MKPTLIDRYATCLLRFPIFGWLIMLGMTVLSVMGWTGFRDQPREWVAWTDSENQEVQQEIDRRAENDESFTGVSTTSLLVIEGDDFFDEVSWRALQTLEARLIDQQMVQVFLWIGSLPDFAIGERDSTMAQRFSGDRIWGWGSRQAYQDVDWEQVREQAVLHPLVDGQLLSADGKTMLVQIEPNGRDAAALSAIRKEAKDILGPAGLTVRITGQLPLYLAHQEAFEKSHFRVMGSAVVVIVILAIVMFRDIRSLILVGLGPALGIIWTLGIFELLGEPTNELTDIVLPVMLLMIAFADVVHLVIDLQRHLALGDKPTEAMKASLHRVGPACVMTSLTTAVGFGSLMLSDSEVIQSFGRSSAIGVLITLVAIILATPLAAQLLRGTSVSKRLKQQAAKESEQAAPSPTGNHMIR